ncbi:MAG: repressor LexA [Candidatus Omnitrophica bacterium]|nr:repressor LexA [Candidatus Omnitrophota bacterium]
MKNRRMPSYSEMLDIFDLRSKNAVFKRIASIVKKGFLEKDQKGKLLPKRLIKPLRLLGSVSAGFPSPAEEELQDVMSLEDYLITNPQSTYLLKVEGDSMIKAGIHHGDLILVEKNRTPKTGDIVIAQVDNEWTVKYFEQKGKRVFLKAANEKYPTIIPTQELVIAGVAIASIRKYK